MKYWLLISFCVALTGMESSLSAEVNLLSPYESPLKKVIKILDYKKDVSEFCYQKSEKCKQTVYDIIDDAIDVVPQISDQRNRMLADALNRAEEYAPKIFETSEGNQILGAISFRFNLFRQASGDRSVQTQEFIDGKLQNLVRSLRDLRWYFESWEFFVAQSDSAGIIIANDQLMNMNNNFFEAGSKSNRLRSQLKFIDNAYFSIVQGLYVGLGFFPYELKDCDFDKNRFSAITSFYSEKNSYATSALYNSHGIFVNSKTLSFFENKKPLKIICHKDDKYIPGDGRNAVTSDSKKREIHLYEDKMWGVRVLGPTGLGGTSSVIWIRGKDSSSPSIQQIMKAINKMIQGG